MGSQRRLEYMDLSRGLVAFLVMAGHLVPYRGYAFGLIFSFHMPFFFLLSGMFTSDRSIRRPFPQYLASLIRSLVIPGIFIRLLLYLTVDRETELGLVRYLLHPYTEWFVPALFFVRIGMYLYGRMERTVLKKELKAVFALTAIGCLLYAASYWSWEGFHNRPAWLPVPMDSACIGLAFAIIGFYLKQVDLWTLSQQQTGKDWLLWGLGSLLLAVFTKYNTYTNVCDVAFGRSDFFFVVIACYFSVLTILLSAQLQKRQEAPGRHPLLDGLCRLIRLMGRNSLLFHIGHMILFELLNRHCFDFLYALAVSVTGTYTNAHYYVMYLSAAILLLAPLAALKEWIYGIFDKQGWDRSFVLIGCIAVCCLCLL